MAKNIFRPMEILPTADSIQIETPDLKYASGIEDVEELLEEYTGPTADELRQEADDFRVKWEAEKSQMLQAAQDEARRIIEQAEQTAFEEVQKKTDQAQHDKTKMEQESIDILEKANQNAAQLEEESRSRLAEVEKDAYVRGFDDGKNNGFDEGKKESERLVERLHVVINNAIEKRSEIIDEAETQLVDLVLLVARKVIKVISENQKNVVINNVVQALRKLKSRGDVAIRVNLNDLDLTTEHTKDFMRMVENVKSVTVLEDSSVEPGGCIIETDFGEIDARISSQLNEIEDTILNLVPIKSRNEPTSEF